MRILQTKLVEFAGELMQAGHSPAASLLLQRFTVESSLVAEADISEALFESRVEEFLEEAFAVPLAEAGGAAEAGAAAEAVIRVEAQAQPTIGDDDAAAEEEEAEAAAAAAEAAAEAEVVEEEEEEETDAEAKEAEVVEAAAEAEVAEVAEAAKAVAPGALQSLIIRAATAATVRDATSSKPQP